jgi:hypothetical protein
MEDRQAKGDLEHDPSILTVRLELAGVIKIRLAWHGRCRQHGHDTRVTPKA